MVTLTIRLSMRVITLKNLKYFRMKHTDAETALRVWYKDIRKAKWESPADLLRDYSRVSIL